MLGGLCRARWWRVGMSMLCRRHPGFAHQPLALQIRRVRVLDPPMFGTWIFAQLGLGIYTIFM